MNGRNLRIAIAVGAIVVALYVILMDISLFSRTFNHPKAVGASTDSTNDTDYEEYMDDDSPRGFINRHSWENNCLKTIEQLCNFPVFPKAPDKRDFATKTDFTIPQHYGHRLFGYLRPNSSGEHHFAITSNGFAEVWLSLNKHWTDAKRVSYIKPNELKTPLKKGNFTTLKSPQISEAIQLKARHKYYFEVISPAPNGEIFVQAAWKRPGQPNFEIIDGEFLSPYTNDSHIGQRKIFDEDLPDSPSCKELNSRYVNKYMNSEAFPYLEATAVENALPHCDYKPSYLREPSDLKGFGQYHGVYKYARKTFSFPYPNVDGIVRNERAGAFIAENPLGEQEARGVVNRYLAALGKAYPEKYQFESITRVEKKEDPDKGSRYLLELKVKDLKSGVSSILSEYVYQPRGKNASLCYPTGLQWSRTADVYLILTSKNLGRWVHHFIKNVERIVRETNDQHVHVIIYDFDSPDIDLEHVLNRSSLTNYRFIKKPGPYSRTVSFIESIKLVTDPDAIVVTIDLHLDMGSQLINDIRKHCVKGKSVYAPQIVFLNCEGSSARPKGTWYHYSYGTIAMYKADWIKFGGFSAGFTKKTTWGGEDWDIIDSAVKDGLEIERKRGPWIYHYFHDKKGMWQKAGT